MGKNVVIQLGTRAADDDGIDYVVEVDVERLLRSRMLVQASSGGGKSYLLRRLAEQLAPHVPVIIIDPEGEFSTLRERFNFVLVGPGGETPADVRSAELVAHKILELRASAVCDIYELPPHARHRWVKLFLSALVDAPKKLWHPTVVIVDEAHVFMPEKGTGESEASGAMIDLATRGRKRGFCAVFATQRLAKLAKNGTAELQNRLIGPTYEGVDKDRAADELSIPRKERDDFYRAISRRDPGVFEAIGGAITKDRILVKVGPVITRHPDIGAKFAGPPPPPSAVKQMLPQLADLPKEAEEKAATVVDLKKRIRELETEVKTAMKAAPKPERVEVKVPMFEPGALDRLERAIKKLDDIRDRAAQAQQVITSELSNLRTEITNARKVNGPALSKTAGASPTGGRTVTTASPPVGRHALPPNGVETVNFGDGDMPKGERTMLTAVAQYGDKGADKVQLSILTGYKRSTRDRLLQYLGAKGYVRSFGDTVRATPEGMTALGGYEALPQGDALRDYWLKRLPEGERRVLEVVAAGFPEAVAKEVIDEKTNYKRSTRDRLIQYLAARKLVTSDRGTVRASEELFG